MNLNKKVLLKYSFLFTVFFIGILLGLFFWNKITLPFQNPWGLIGPLTLIKFNPINNIIRFFVFISLPLFILIAIYLLRIKTVNDFCFGEKPIACFNSKKKISFSIIEKIFFTIIIIFFSIVVAMNIPTYHSYGMFDTFHEGESLGTSISYLAGKSPYKDFIFCHGLFQDPLRSVIAFNLFGKSIGAVRTIESIIKIFSFVLLFLFLLKINRNNFLNLFLFLFTLLILLTFHQFKIYNWNDKFLIVSSREITTFSFLILITFLNDFITQKNISKIKLIVVTFLFSFIPLASFIYSIDRGFYLFSTYIIISPILYFLFFHKNDKRVYYIVSSLFGILSAVILLGVLIHWNLYEFIKYIFFIIPKSKELMDGLIYPIFETRFLAISIIIALNIFWITYKFLQEVYLNSTINISIKKFIEKYFIEFCLLILSVFFYRSALGRSDWEHVSYSSFIIYFLFIFIIFKKYLNRYNIKKKYVYFFTLLIIVVSIFGVSRILKKSLIVENFPYKNKDSVYILDNYKATITYLKNNLSHEEKIFTMTNEASWYYFVDKPCPTRFPVVWFASPSFYQKEVVADLKNNNIKFIIYNSDNKVNLNAIDGRKLPLINDYVTQNYYLYKTIDENEIWIKK